MSSPQKEKDSHSQQVVCPVCKKIVHNVDLPNKEGVITDSLYFDNDILIVDSDVTIHCEFEHRHDEQKKVLKRPHEVVAVIRVNFDESGECNVFEIVELLDPEKGD